MLLLLQLLLATDPAGNVVTGSTAPSYPILGGKGAAQLLLNADTGSPEAAVDRLTLTAGATIPEHVHEKSVEILYVESGALEMIIGGKAFTAHAGDAIYIPPNTKHSGKVAGAETVTAVQVYVGPGPEQRFKPAPKK